MRIGHLRGIVACFIVGLAAVLILSGIPTVGAEGPRTRQGELFLLVGGQDQMKTRNLLPASANDVWTSDVHYRVYHSLLLGHPTLDQPMAYIAKGVDVNENGVFEATEYDQWRKESGTNNLDVVVYYDFNGVYWHDGRQMTVWDVFFSYHVAAQNARFNTDLRVLYCGPIASYESCGRALNMEMADADGDPSNGFQRNWQNEGSMAGDPTKRVAIHYTLNQEFALFYESTLFPVMLPIHEWARTGAGRHQDFGCAVWIPPTEASDRGIPACGNTDPNRWGDGIASTESVPGSTAFQYLRAETWNGVIEMVDADVIGNGPFRFDSWVPNVEARVVRNERYFTGVDPDNPSIVYDPQLARVLKKPTIDGIRYKVYTTTQLGVFALQNAEIDFYHWNVGADFVNDLLKIPEIAVEANAEPGFFYLAYNFRLEPWGYRNGDPAQGDMGIGFRDAVSHLVDKKSIVQNLLGNFGVIGHGTVSPANTFWYNDNIPKPDYNLNAARAILNDLSSSTDGGQYYEPGYTTDPPGTCDRTTPLQCRSIPKKGKAVFEILTPETSYDPVRATAGANVAADMRAVGINAVSRPMAFGEIVQRINAHDFDLFILGWRIGGTDPDYLFSFFHCSNAALGQNYPGYCNPTFDQVISDSRAELDRSQRQALIFEAQRILAVDRPYEVLYFRTNIEGYRQDRFVNWTVSSGTIWGFWSLEGIRPPSTRALRASISTESATRSGASELVTVTVFDHENKALSNAAVTLSVGAGNDQGNLSIGGGPEMKSVSDTTDLNGQVRVTYVAANVQAETQVIIDGVATHEDFPDPSARSAVIRVFPPGVQFLSLRVELQLGDRVTRGSSIPMGVDVTNQDRNTVSDAIVTVFVTPPADAIDGDLAPSPSTGSAVEMSAVTLTAKASAGVGEYDVAVRAELLGFEPAITPTFLITVASAGGGGTYTCDDGRKVNDLSECLQPSTPALDVVWVLAGIGITALVVGVVAERKRRS